MILAVLLTLMAGKVYDATPTRDENHGQETEEEGEEEDVEMYTCSNTGLGRKRKNRWLCFFYI